MEHAKGLQLHNIAKWDTRHLPTLRSLYEVSMFKPVARRGVHNVNNNDDAKDDKT